jgi:hypothetical protein
MSYSQNKKEQITYLTEKLDSTENVCKTRIDLLRDSIVLLQGQKTNLLSQEEQMKNEIARMKKQLSSVQKSMDSISKIYSNSKSLPLETNNKFVGSYEFAIGEGNEEDEYSRMGSLQLYSNGDGKYYFTLDYNIGAPSYNMGTLTGSFLVYGDKGVFYANVNSYFDEGETINEEDLCRVVFMFDENGVFVNQMSSDMACGFGSNVIVQDYFIRENTINKKIDLKDVVHSTNKW